MTSTHSASVFPFQHRAQNLLTGESRWEKPYLSVRFYCSNVVATQIVDELVIGTQVSKPEGTKVPQGFYYCFMSTMKEQWRILITQGRLIWG